MFQITIRMKTIGNKKYERRVLKVTKDSSNVVFKADASIGPVVSGVSRSVFVVASKYKTATGVRAYRKK